MAAQSPSSEPSPPEEARVFGRHVPERKDDFAWENDRVAFRIYGPALEADNEISSGIDVWSKSTDRLILDSWYARGDYHTDHGEGADFYKVGPTRGCGGLAIWHHGAMHPSRNWVAADVTEMTSDYLEFRLVYAPWAVGDREFRETRVMSLEAGSNLNRIEPTIESDVEGPLTIAIGITMPAGAGLAADFDMEHGVMMVWGPTGGDHGESGYGVIVDPDSLVDMIERDEHAIAIVRAETGTPFVYHAGATWSRSPVLSTSGEWQDYLLEFSRKLY